MEIREQATEHVFDSAYLSEVITDDADILLAQEKPTIGIHCHRAQFTICNDF